MAWHGGEVSGLLPYSRLTTPPGRMTVEEATEVLESSARGALTITSLAEESRPPAAAGETHPHE